MTESHSGSRGQTLRGETPRGRAFPDAARLVEPAAELSAEEVRRYSRHLIIPQVGMEGQRRLKNARVLVIGAGGLGSPTLLYLAAAGVGTIGVVDDDVVEESNLQRQVIHGQADLGRPKVESARDHVAQVNPLVTVEPHHTRLTSENALDIVSGYDLVVDGADNFATRYLVNDACVLLGKPYVWGSIFRFDGQVSVFWAGHGPCYRCLFPEPPPPGAVPSCAEGGVLGVLPAAIGSAQATEAIKVITGIGRTLLGRLQLYDALDGTWRELGVRRDDRCAICGDHPTVTELIDYQDFCGVAQAPAEVDAPSITVTELRSRLGQRDRGERDFVLIDVREAAEREINQIPGSIHVPKSRFESGDALEVLPGDTEIVLYCKSGVRSAQCLGIVRRGGLSAVHVEGGVAAWVERIEPHQNRY